MDNTSVDAHGHVVEKRRPVDPCDVHRLQSRGSEGVQRRDRIASVQAQVHGEVVAGTGGNADHLDTGATDQVGDHAQRSVPAGDSHHIGSFGQSRPGQIAQVRARPEPVTFDPPGGGDLHEIEVLGLAVPGPGIDQQDRFVCCIDRDARGFDLGPGTPIHTQRVPAQGQRTCDCEPPKDHRPTLAVPPDGGDEGYRQQANGNPGRPIALLSARSQGDPAEPDCGQQREEGEQDGEGAFSETARHGQQADAESQQGADSRGSTTKGERDVAHGQRFETRSAVDWPMPIPIKAPTATSAG